MSFNLPSSSSSFDIPSLIPPLPSMGKENKVLSQNRGSDMNHGSLSQLSKHSPSMPSTGTQTTTSSTSSNLKRHGLSLRTPQATPPSTTIRSSEDKAISSSRYTKSVHSARQRLHMSPSPVDPKGLPSTTTTHRSKSVLRFGETTESLFCITPESTQEHRKLARSIVETSLADDPAAWYQILQIVSKVPSIAHSDLMRLHRRATMRFPLDAIMSDSTRPHIRDIWLEYAALHQRLGAIEEARRTFRYMEHQKIPLDAKYFLALANAEKSHDMSRATNALKRGIAEKAQPVETLKQALSRFSNENLLDSKPAASESKPLSIATTATKGVHFPKTSIQVAGNSSSSPKRQKTENGFVPRNNNGEINPTPEDPPQNRALAPLIPKSSSKGMIIPPNTLSAKVKAANSEITGKLQSTRRPSRLSARLSRKGLSGKAKRVDTSVLDDSDSESDDDDEEEEEDEVERENHCGNTTHEITNQLEIKPTKTKCKKLDLSYMWEWDPNARGKTAELKPPKSGGEKTEGSCSSGPSTSASQATSSVTEASSSSAVVENCEPKEVQQVEKTEVAKVTQHDDSIPQVVHDVETTNTERKGEPARDQLAGINREFLPLVHENNILHVNGASYAKLGVIGKGGSCKVYRALSKKCSVVAIKKVKLDGMDEKAIEGYANEISLLKRLRGNPAIIQMYDNEVDLARKSLFVVMEAGEADLNHILQQRALSGTSRSLNMNFVRLTWQQMLSAVHCIHEERIIHSDLKPANFLFVRGALKLIDFGIAKAIQSDDTTNIYRESHIGTLNYMSPEAILDTETGSNGPRMRIGRASDVWSLGCILYEMVYGKSPFAKLHFIQKLQAIVNPNHQIEFEWQCDEGALDAIKKCLQRNPDDRPPIVGKGGLLNEHRFLHSSSKRQVTTTAKPSS